MSFTIFTISSIVFKIILKEFLIEQDFLNYQTVRGNPEKMDSFPLLNICLCKLFSLFATPLILLLLVQLPRKFQQSNLAMLIRGVQPKLILENWNKNCLLYLSLPQEQLWTAHMGGENSIIGTNMHGGMLKAFTELLFCSLKKINEIFWQFSEGSGTCIFNPSLENLSSSQVHSAS